MTIDKFNPDSFNWDRIPPLKANGETGFAIIKSKAIGDIKVRQVEYSSNYLADHWCDKGHIVFVVDGQLIIEHKDNLTHTINSGMTYLVGDNYMSHKVRTISGAKVIIIN